MKRVEPLTEFQWRFFLVQDLAGFDRLAERSGDDAGEFWFNQPGVGTHSAHPQNSQVRHVGEEH
jgi:hypothetical protein